ncbi:MAG: hypothetical protein Q7T64_11165 [Lacisediminimonas sp.]|nr:hypothetical protein [Lacisediminimonas sp.]
MSAFGADAEADALAFLSAFAAGFFASAFLAEAEAAEAAGAAECEAAKAEAAKTVVTSARMILFIFKPFV